MARPPASQTAQGTDSPRDMNRCKSFVDYPVTVCLTHAWRWHWLAPDTPDISEGAVMGYPLELQVLIVEDEQGSKNFYDALFEKLGRNGYELAPLRYAF